MQNSQDLQEFLSQPFYTIHSQLFSTNDLLLGHGIFGKTGNGRKDGHSFIGYDPKTGAQFIVLGTPVNYSTFNIVKKNWKIIKGKKFP